MSSWPGVVRAVRTGVVSAVALVLANCAKSTHPDVIPTAQTPPSPSQYVAAQVIAEVKDFAVSLGGHTTGNFLTHSALRTSDTRCYFTGKLQLPEFYSGLQMVREEEERCTARSAEHDVFFYPVEAVASGEESITVSLADAPPERLLVVVPHEDFHNQREAGRAPTEVAEAAATLVGFLTASSFANDRFGADSLTARMLAGDADLFLRKSFVVNAYYEKVSAVYGEFRSGGLTAAQALERKAELFGQLQRSCSEIAPDPVSFNKCPAAINNAGLAFDRTYTRHYPMLHDLYKKLGSDPSALIPALKQLMADWPGSVAGVVDLIRRE